MTLNDLLYLAHFKMLCREVSMKLCSRYDIKINSGDRCDMCRLEFNYACQKNKQIQAVVTDNNMCNTRNWTGRLSGDYSWRYFHQLTGS